MLSVFALLEELNMTAAAQLPDRNGERVFVASTSRSTAFSSSQGSAKRSAKYSSPMEEIPLINHSRKSVLFGQATREDVEIKEIPIPQFSAL